MNSHIKCPACGGTGEVKAPYDYGFCLEHQIQATLIDKGRGLTEYWHMLDNGTWCLSSIQEYGPMEESWGTDTPYAEELIRDNV
jgi:hypothetical protein